MVNWKTITIDKDGTLHQFKYTTDEYDEDIERDIPYVSDGSDSTGFGMSPPNTSRKMTYGTFGGGESKKPRRIVKPKKLVQRVEEREDALQAAAEAQAEGGIPFQGGSNIKKRRKKRKTKRKKRRKKKKRNRKSRKIRGGHNHGLHLGGGKFLLGGGI